MSTLAKFLAYRAKPPVKLLPVSANAKKPSYKHTGFLNNSETKEERTDRLFQAIMDGFHLSFDDYQWLTRRARKTAIIFEKHNAKDHARMNAILSQTRDCFGGAYQA